MGQILFTLSYSNYTVLVTHTHSLTNTLTHTHTHTATLGYTVTLTSDIKSQFDLMRTFSVDDLKHVVCSVVLQLVTVDLDALCTCTLMPW